MSVAFGVTLTIISGLCWGALDAVRKQLAAHLEALPLTAWLVFGQLPVFTLWVVLSEQYHISAEWLAPGLSVSALALFAAILFVRAVQVSPLSLVIPMLSLTPAFAILISALTLGERPTQLQLIGVGFVVSGALILGRAGTQTQGRGWREPGLWMMTAVAWCWACTLTLDKLALRHADVPIHALAQSVVIGLSVLIILALRSELGRLRSLRGQVKLYLFAVGLGSLATGLQLIAVKSVLVGVVEGIKRSLGLTLAVANGALFFGEPLTPLKLFAVLWMGLGVLFLVI